MKICAAAIFVTAVLATGGTALSAEVERGKCDAVLVKDTFAENTDSRLILSILQTLDDKSYEQFKTQTKGGVKIPIEGIPIDLSGSWDDFRERRNELQKRYNYNYDSRSSRTIAIASASDGAVEAWSQCMIGNSRNVLIARPRFQSETDIFVQVYWQPGVDPKPGRLEDIKVVGGKLVGKAPKSFLSKWTALHFVREPKKEFSATINIRDGDAASITIPAAKRTSFTRSLACREYADEGCVTCIIPIAGRADEKNLARAGRGGTQTYICRDMVPNAIAYAALNASIIIDGGGTKFNWVSLALSINGSNEKIETITNVQPPMKFPITSYEQKVSSNGVATIGLRVQHCQYNVENTVHMCSVSATPGSEIEVQVKGAPGSLTHLQKLDRAAIRGLQIKAIESKSLSFERLQ